MFCHMWQYRVQVPRNICFKPCTTEWLCGAASGIWVCDCYQKTRTAVPFGDAMLAMMTSSLRHIISLQERSALAFWCKHHSTVCAMCPGVDSLVLGIRSLLKMIQRLQDGANRHCVAATFLDFNTLFLGATPFGDAMAVAGLAPRCDAIPGCSVVFAAGVGMGGCPCQAAQRLNPVVLPTQPRASVRDSQL